MPSAVTPRPMYDASASRTVKDAKYLAWIKTLPCLVCRRKSEAAHTGSRGLSQKSSDRKAVPFCCLHHKEYHRIGRRRFERSYKLDIEAVILKLNQKPLVRIVAGRFVALLDGEEYSLRPVSDGVAAMTRSAVAICRERPLVMQL
jgi:hypothetical protein